MAAESSLRHDSKYKQCGFNEMLTCLDQPPIAGNYSTRQPRAAYQVYAAYGNTSGMMMPVSRQCADADALTSYDSNHNSSHDDSSGSSGGTTASAWVGALCLGSFGFLFPSRSAAQIIR